MKKFTLRWVGGHNIIIKGKDLDDACRKAGIRCHMRNLFDYVGEEDIMLELSFYQKIRNLFKK